METKLAELFQSYQLEEHPPVIVLENINHIIVGVLYLNSLSLKDLVISETQLVEYYFLVANGVGIYFSFFKKIYPEDLYYSQKPDT